MSRYAANTEVTTDKSKAEIERTLRRYGANGFGYAWKGDMNIIQFEMRGKRILFQLPMPARSDFRLTENGNARTSNAAIDAAWEQAQRQRWRALLLVIKAKLEAVEAGITDFESEFLAATLLPGGMTVGGFMKPQVEESYRTGEMPALLPGLSAETRLLLGE